MIRSRSLEIVQSPRANLGLPAQNVVIDRGEGVWLHDVDGRRYLDCAAGTFNLSLGYSHREVLDVVREQMEKLIHCTSSLQNEPVNRLVRKLAEVAPKNLTRVHPKVSSGSVANEGAVKMAQYVTGKRDVISFFHSHHGQSMMTLSISGSASRREPYPALYEAGLQVPGPYCYRCFYKLTPDTCNFLCVERIHDFLEHAGSGRVACMILEPITGNGGNVVPPPGWLQAIRALCDERGIMLIFDEIQTGIGRTGKMFAADHFGVSPNAMTLSKGLGGTGFQVSAILTEESLGAFPAHHHAFTYGANVLAAAAAAKTLEIVGRPGFLDHVTAMGDYIMERLRAAQRRHRFIGDVRGVGLMIGAEIVAPDGAPDVDRTNRIARAALDHGLIIRTSGYGHGNVIKIRPPLIIQAHEAEYLCDHLDALLAEVG
jgi:4-aminobutyrate aminotransferase